MGGADKGGIIVRSGESTSSDQTTERLSTGATVREILLAGERLNYEKLSGDGPSRGWVSLRLKGKDLLVKIAEAAALDSAACGSWDADQVLSEYKSGGLEDRIQEFRQILCKMAHGPPVTEPRENGVGTPWDRYVPPADAKGKPRLLLHGDSITHGAPHCESSPYAAAVAYRNPNLSVENAGWGGLMSISMLDPQQFEPFKSHGIKLPKPGEFGADFVCILIGTNDAMAICGGKAFTDAAYASSTGGPAAARLPQDWAVKCPPSVQLYEQNIQRVVRLHRDSGAKVALATPPLLGEAISGDLLGKKLDASPFSIISDMAASVHRVARAEGVAVIPLFESMVFHMKNLKRSPIIWTPPAFQTRMAATFAARSKERKDGSEPRLFCELGAANGRPEMCFDLVHFNEDAAALYATLVQAWLDTEVVR